MSPNLPSANLAVASIQMESSPGDKEANLAQIEQLARQAAGNGARLIILPECVISGYWFIRNLTLPALKSLAEPVPQGPSVQRLAALARQTDAIIGAGLIEKAEDAFFNTYVLAFPDGTTARHRKLHAFEHEAIQSGSDYTVVELGSGWRAGILICYDCNIIENARLTALAGAHVLIAPHQTGGVRSKDPHLMGLIDRKLWENRHVDPASIEREFQGEKGRGWLLRWLPSRAHDNGMFLIFSNGVGVDDDEIRTGNAMVLDPYGRILAETGKAGDDIVTATLDPALLQHATGRKWMRARRPDLYGAISLQTGNEADTRQMKFEE